MNMLSWLPELIWLSMAILIPLIFNPLGSNVFELPKTVLLQAGVLLLMPAAFISRVQQRKGCALATKEKLLGRLTLGAALGYGIVLVLATLNTVNSYDSLWGSYERKQGLITQLSYVIMFLLIAVLLRTRRQATRLWDVLIWGSAPIVAYGVLQALHLDPLQWQIDSPTPVLATMGRSNFLGSYLVLLLPLTLGRMLIVKRRWPYGVLAVGQGSILIIAQSRAAWLGATVAVITLSALWLMTHRSHRISRAGRVVALLLGALVLGVILPKSAGGVEKPAAQDSQRMMIRADAGSSAARLTIWKTTVPLIAARPWLGYGPDNMRSAFARVFPPELVYYQGRNTDIDRAHSVWLDLGMSIGLVGVAAWTSLLLIVMWKAWRMVRVTPARWLFSPGAAFMAAVTGHLVDLQFSFEVTATATIFWLSLATLAAIGRGLTAGPTTGRSQARPTVSEGFAYALPTVVAGVMISVLCVRPLLADIAYRTSLNSAELPTIRLSAGWRAINLWPVEQEYRWGLAQILGQTGQWVEADRQLHMADQLRPNDARTWAIRGALYLAWAQFDQRYLGEAGQALRQATTLAPNLGTYHATLGAVLRQQGHLQESVDELNRAVELDATDGEAYQQLGQTYLALNQQSDAALAFEYARKLGY